MMPKPLPIIIAPFYVWSYWTIQVLDRDGIKNELFMLFTPPQLYSFFPERTQGSKNIVQEHQQPPNQQAKRNGLLN